MANRPRPTKTTISGRKFKINSPVKIDESDSEGESSIEKRHIQIRSDLNSRDFESCLLHETIHMILEISGNAEEMSEAQEERIVIALEYGLIELYQRIKK